MGGDNFLDDTVESSGVTASGDEEEVAAVSAGAGVSILFECGTTDSDLSLGGLEEPLNILFSNPPWFEPRRLFPASLKVGGREKEILLRKGEGDVYFSQTATVRKAREIEVRDRLLEGVFLACFVVGGGGRV